MASTPPSCSGFKRPGNAPVHEPAAGHSRDPGDWARDLPARREALIEGSIAPLGSQYVLTLAAMNAANGADIARVQTTAASKEQVLHALSGAATELRRQLGESMASILKYDAPLEATTMSLDALNAYVPGRNNAKITPTAVPAELRPE